MLHLLTYWINRHKYNILNPFADFYLDLVLLALFFLFYFMCFSTKYNIQFKTKAEFENFHEILRLTKVVNAQGLPQLTDWELAYLLRATPNLETSPRFNLPDGREGNAAELIAYELNTKCTADTVMEYFSSFHLWLNTSHPLLKDLGFPVFNLPEEKTHIYGKTYFSPGLYTAMESSKKDQYLPYKKYGMRHYGHSFSRPARKKAELEELAKAFNFYYEYFKEGSQGYDQLQDFYPRLLNTTNYKGEAVIVRGSRAGEESYFRLPIRVPHISIAALCHCLPYVECVEKRAKICDSLKFALYCKLVYYTAAHPSTVRTQG